MANQPSQSPPNTPQPASSSGEASAHLPDSQPAGTARGSVIAAFAVGIMLTVVVMLIIFSAFISGDGSSLNENDVRGIVAEVIGTQNAQQPLTLSNGDGALDSQAIQELIDNSVSTQVALLKPTNTPIPPTPTVIPVGVAEDDDAFLGPEDAPVVIVEFSDFQCGYCGRWYATTLQSILEAYPNEVKFVYRDFPIFGEDSLRAAMATECAEEQDPDAFWGMHDRLFDRLNDREDIDLSAASMIRFADDLGLDTESFAECLTTDRYLDEILNDYRAATEYGLGGTPGFVINGVVYAIGAQPFEVFDSIIQAELANVRAEG